MNLRRRTHQLVETCKDPGDHLSRAVDVGVLGLIGLSVCLAMIESVPRIGARYAVAFEYFDTVVLVVFVLEYLLRVWSCVEDPRWGEGRSGRLRYMAQPLMVVDLVAILPALIPTLTRDLLAVRVLRLVRVLRVAKLTRYSSALRLLLRVVWSRRGELGVTLYLAVLMVVGSGTVMYVLEHPAQPRVFSSIPASCWWAVTTLTTIGYGDMAPVTPLGRVIASCISVFALGLFALPAGILGSGFVEALQGDEGGARPALCTRCAAELGAGEAPGDSQDEEGKRRVSDPASAS